MNEVFWDFLHHFVIIYTDDILIYFWNLAEHCHHVMQVLQKLREYHLYLMLEKCEFHGDTIHFLRYITSKNGMQIDQRKVDAIRSCSQPDTIKDLQHFLGFSNFYHWFIPNYSSVSSSLTSLLKNQPKSLSWNPLAMKAF